MNVDLSGKCAIVTGGSRGIGKSIVEILTLHHTQCFSVSRHESDKFFEHDLSKKFYREWTYSFADILVNNVGAQSFAPALEYTRKQWKYDIELMLTAAFDLSQRAAKGMKERGHGKIINIASIAGIQGTRNTIGYSVAKAGLIHLTKCLSNELAPYNIQVNAVAPGYIETDMLKPLLSDEKHAAEIKGRIPAGKWGKPEDVANAVLFLASPAADYITGVCLPVDGGWLAR